MKTLLLITCIGLFAVGCSSSKTTVASTSVATDPITPPEQVVHKTTASPEIGEKINIIIQDRLGIPLKAIARSKITQTEKGYEWKFMNVRTGEKFMGNSDFGFQTIEIFKNKKS